MTQQASPPDPSSILCVEQVAAVLSTSLSTIYKLSRRGYPDYPRSSRLPNGRIVTRASSLDSWIEEMAR